MTFDKTKDVCKSITTQIICEFNETKDDFIFTSIARAFEKDEIMSKVPMSKEIMKRALLCFRDEHTEEYHRLLDESCKREDADKEDCVNYRNGNCIISADYAPRCGKCDAYQTEEDVQANGYIGLLGSVLRKRHREED